MAEKPNAKILDALKGFGEEFGTLRAAPEHKDLIAGDYACRFEPSKSGLWEAETGRVGFKVCFVILDGEYEGRRLYTDLWIQSDDSKAKEMAKRDLLKLGLAPADLVNPPAVEGKFIVTLKGDEDGGIKVRKFVNSN